eukprot:TRINITY_DN24072_c0_g1_i1.p1 TRINITY_DN24072_c0_g1~~TRINITY_DN24072_c0_g1_i1.p1  ORF type:complete len:1347 (+),score=211.70 TRINITY_DN24072_c0_g1_i1:365-4042(+)
MAACCVVSACGSCAYSYLSQAAGVNGRAAVSGAVFRKCLRLGSAQFQGSAIGEVTTLFSSDCSQLSAYTGARLAILLQPFEIAALLALLWFFVGAAAIGAFAVILFSMATSAPVSRCLERGSLAKASLAESRMQLLSEVLGGIKVVKLNAWEKLFEERIVAMREKERRLSRRVGMLQSLLFLTSEKIVDGIAAVVIGIYVLWMDRALTPAIAFGFWIVLASLHSKIFGFPEHMRKYGQGLAATRRLEAFLLQAEESVVSMEIDVSNSAALGAKDLCLSFTERGSSGESRKTGLSNVNLSVERGQMLGMVGRVGEGKSCLLAALLGEISTASFRGGKVLRDIDRRVVGYAPQVPFMRSASVRENIIFGSRFDEHKYAAVVSACCLDRDFALLPQGDDTIIGTRGLNISGGQKQRIGLARAAYADSDILILDDTLSACDGEVANHIFQKCLLEFCGSRARVLVTQQHRFLMHCNHVAVVSDGSVVLVQRPDTAPSSLFGPSEDTSAVNGQSVDNEIHVQPPPALIGGEGAKPSKANGQLRCVKGVCWFLKHFVLGLNGLCATTVALLLVLGDVALVEFSVYILWQWSEGNSSYTPFEYWIGYVIFVVAYWCTAVSRHFVIIFSADRATHRLHKSMLRSTLGAKMDYFSSSTLGELLAMLSEKLEIVQSSIFNSSELFILGLTFGIFTTVYSIMTSPWLALPFGACILCLGSLWVGSGNSDVGQRALDLSAPVLESFQEMLVGLNCVRAFKQEESFITRHNLATDDHSSALLASQKVESKREMLSGLMGSCMYVSVAASLLFRSTSAGQAGFLIVNATFANAIVAFVFGNMAVLQSIAATRDQLLQGTKLPQEDATSRDTRPFERMVLDTGSGEPAVVLEMKMVSMRYGVNMPLVLNDVSFTLLTKESMGVVGRTGAGKSSLVAVTTRLVGTCKGMVLFEGRDITTCSTSDLRSRMVIVSQDCLLFAGTIRGNLDPFGQYGNAELTDACRKARLSEHVERLGGLDAEVQDGGSNFSVGQRQLLCLARMFLRSSNLVLVDEATASLDPATDLALQEVMQEFFFDGERAAMIIAHRLQTVAAADRVLCMEDGRVVEVGQPWGLLNGEGTGHFASLVAAAGEKEAAQIHAKAAKSAKVTIEDEAPAEDNAPAEDEAHVEDEAPAEDEALVEDKANADDDASVEDEAPAEDEDPVEDEVPDERNIMHLRGKTKQTEAPLGDDAPAEDVAFGL